MILVRANGLSALLVAVLCWVSRAVVDNAMVCLHCGKDKIWSAIFAARSCEVLVRASCYCALLVAAVRCVRVRRILPDRAVIFLHGGKDKIRFTSFVARSRKVLVRPNGCTSLVVGMRGVCRTLHDNTAFLHCDKDYREALLMS